MADEVRKDLGIPQRGVGAELLWKRLEAERALNPADLDREAEPETPTRIGLDAIVAHALDRVNHLRIGDRTP